jgi:hypothetical protein
MLMISEQMRLADTDSVIERRRGLRIEQDRPVKVLNPIGLKYFGGTTRDISSTGLRIEVPLSAPVQAGEELAVHVGLSDRGMSLANRRHMMRARVVWIDRSKGRKTGKMQLGVEFMASISAGLDAA